jgi:hypothetical protein
MAPDAGRTSTNQTTDFDPFALNPCQTMIETILFSAFLLWIPIYAITVIAQGLVAPPRRGNARRQHYREMVEWKKRQARRRNQRMGRAM